MGKPWLSWAWLGILQLLFLPVDGECVERELPVILMRWTSLALFGLCMAMGLNAQAQAPEATPEVTPATAVGIPVDTASATVETPSAEPAAEAAALKVSSVSERAEQRIEADKLAGRKKVKARFSAYLRTRYGAVLDSETNPDFVGQNDGFRLDNARLQVDLKDRQFLGRFSIDGAVDQRDADNTSRGQMKLSLRDAWMAWQPMKIVRLGAGQFKPAFDGEELRSTQKMLFIERAVESRGIRGVEGWNVAGLSLNRELGLFAQVRLGLSNAVTVVTDLSVSNGNSASDPVNDNDTLAGTGRIAVEIKRIFSLGGGYRMNEMTSGDAPDRLSDEVSAWVGDLKFRIPVGAITFMGSGQYMQRSVSSVDVPTEPNRTGTGYHAALGVRLFDGLELAYRYASLDPTSEFETTDAVAMAVLDADGVIHHTVGLNYAPDPEKNPVKVQVNYTRAVEDDGLTIDNDRLDILLQFAFKDRG